MIVAKRFTDTEKFIDPWFRRLSSKHKLLWDWLLCNCDFAGIISIDMEFIEMVLNEKYSDSDIEFLFSERVLPLTPFKYFIPKFIRFQYGKKLNKESRVHSSVIERLKENSIDPDTLSIAYPASSDRAKDKEKEKDKAKEKVKDSLKEEEAEKNLPEKNSQEKLKKLTPDEVVNIWNENMGKTFGHVVSLGAGEHRDNCLKSFEFLPTEKHWVDLFELCKKYPRLTGNNNIGWAISLTWLVNFDNALKVLNGDYDEEKVVRALFASMNSSGVAG